MRPIKLGKLVFAAVIGLAVMVGVAFFIPELSLTGGHTHAQFSTIRQGGDPHGIAVIWLGWLFGTITLIFFFLVISLGVARGNNLRGLGKYLVAICAATVAAWSGIVVTYQGFVSNPDQALLFGFPLPTGLMIFVFPLTGLLVTILFVVQFPKSILTEEDLERYRQLKDAGDESS